MVQLHRLKCKYGPTGSSRTSASGGSYNRMAPWRALGVFLYWILLIASVPLLQEGPFVFVDWQESPYTGGPFERLYSPSNGVEGAIQNVDFATGLASILTVVSSATGTRVRAFGSKWTYNNIPYVDESMVDSAGLNYCQVGINSTYLTGIYVDLASQLVFVQAGVTIQALSQALLEKKLALSTSGHSDGQRIAGAMSTGTHGSRFQYGAMEEMIRAIHIVTHGNRHVLLQGEAVVNQAFATYLGNATLIQDEKLFNTAKVCFGSCGIIHGYVLQVEPLYQLRRVTKKYSYAAVANTLDTLDVSGLDGIGNIFTNPFHIQIVLNPFDKAFGAYVEVMDQQPYDGRHLQATAEEPGETSGPDLSLLDFPVSLVNNPILRFIDKMLFGGGLSRLICGVIMGSIVILGTKTPDKVEANLPSVTFGDPVKGLFPWQTTNTEICVSLERTTDALAIIDNLILSDPLPFYYSLRFVKKTTSTLGFTKFDTSTAIELLGFQDATLWTLTYDWYERLFAAFETADIPYSYHWGKRFPLNKNWVPKTYGDALTEWQEQRRILLDSNEPMFRNDVLDQLGL